MFTTRRLFLKNAAQPVALCFASAVRHRAAATTRQLSKEDVAQFRSDLLKQVNTERLLAGASSLAIDDLACVVADKHALDMASKQFLSHWGSDGGKPYHRYSDAGGFQEVQENVSATDDIESPTAKYIAFSLAQMHMKMHAEVPPNDGHRRTILAPQHTHAGFGIALADRDLRLVELYFGKHVHLEPYQRQANRKTTVQLSGKLLDAGYRLSYAEVFYEQLPVPPDLSWLRVGRPYGLPDEYRTIRPMTPDGMHYADGVRGEIELGDHGRFRIPVKFYKDKPGIYTVVIWISARDGRGRFAATNLCIQVN